MTIELTPKELSHLKIVVRAEYFTMQSDLEEIELDDDEKDCINAEMAVMQAIINKLDGKSI